MSARGAISTEARGTLRTQIPAFAAIGAFGYLIDAAVTYSFIRYFDADPLVARLPAFLVATIVNFALNRAWTFADSSAPLVRAFLRYVMVCAAGLCVNYAAYAFAITAAKLSGHPPTAAATPLFVACGSGAAMFVTFLGFRLYAFRG